MERQSESGVEGDIEVDGRRVAVPPGLRRVEEIRALAGGGDHPLFLDRPDHTATPLSPSDHILVRGGERLVKGSIAADDNPRLPNPIRPTLNGQAIEVQRAKATGLALKGNDTEFPGGRLFVESADDVDVEIPDDVTVVVRETDVYFVVPPSPEGGSDIDLEECGKHGRRPPRGNYRYRVRVDGSKHTLESATATGAEVLALVGKNSHDWSLNRKLRGGRRSRIQPDDVIDLCKPGVERFETVRLQAQQGYG